MDKKVWLITGISSGLGKALAEAVLDAGEFVCATFRKESQVENFNKKYKGKGFAFKLDITKENDIESTIESIISKYAQIDYLVNNAGVGFTGAIEETSMDEVRLVMNANFFGTLKITQSVLPHMREKQTGHIIQISSHGGIKAFAGFGIYNASKFALEGFSEALAQEVEPLGIKVKLIEPGPFRTNFAGSGLMEAKNVISDYSNTAGVFREKLKSVNGLQEGDPNKAAKAIYDFVKSDSKALRLPLGKTPLVTIQMKLDSVKADLKNCQEIANSVVF